MFLDNFHNYYIYYIMEFLSQSAWSREAATHLLSRMRFGGAEGEVEALYQRGVEAGYGVAVDELVDVPVDWAAYPFPQWAQGNGNGEQTEHFLQLEDFTGWYLDQMARLPGVHAKMWKFFVDHFPVDLRKFKTDRQFIYLFRHFDLLRKGALGNFRALVEGVSWSEAMITMLDLQTSSRDAVNENFAREVMELFTLGVDAGYSEADVLACAQAFTGRRLSMTAPFDAYLDEGTYFGGNRHGQYRYIDPTRKEMLVEGLQAGVLEEIAKPAEQTPGAPKEHGARAIEIILAQPNCGKHLAWKLWRYFVSPVTDPALIAELGDRLRVTHGYNLNGILKDIFKSRAFYEEAVRGDQIKDPVDLLISTCHVLNVPLPPAKTSRLCLIQLGYDPAKPDSIEGWPEPEHEGNQWLSTSYLMFRTNLPKLFTHGNINALTDYQFADHPSLRTDPVDYDALVPDELRAPRNLHLLIDHLARRFFPLRRLSIRQKRVIANHMGRLRPGVPAKGVRPGVGRSAVGTSGVSDAVNTNRMNRFSTCSQGMTRREMLRSTLMSAVGASSLGPIFQNSLLAADGAANTEDILVVVELSGGNDWLNTLVPYDAAGSEVYYHPDERPNLAISAPSVLPVRDGYGFHPNLTNLKGIWDDGDMAIINGVGYPRPNLSHFTSFDYWHTAQFGQSADDGWLGRFFEHRCSSGNCSSTVGVDLNNRSTRAFQSSEAAGVSMSSPEALRWVENNGAKGDPELEEVFQDLLVSGESGGAGISFVRRSAASAITAARIIREASESRDPAQFPSTEFPTSGLGKQLLNVAALIAGGLSTQVFYVHQLGYDTHAAQIDGNGSPLEGVHANLLLELDQALGAFVTEMRNQGNWGRVLIVTISEFGRKVRENGSLGTDHGAGSGLFAMGSRVNPGFYGAYPSLASSDRVKNHSLDYHVDFRIVYRTLVERWLNVTGDAVSTILPGMEELAGKSNIPFV